MRCPYLALDGDRSQAMPEPTSGHRCHLIAIRGNHAQPEWAGSCCRAQICLGQAHFPCLHLAPGQPYHSVWL